MERLGPFGASPNLAIGVSGGADSTALALLARDWTQAHGGAVLALIVDHGLRAESALQARETARRLAEGGIASEIFTLTGLPARAKLQESARAARHEALAKAARARGCLFLLLGHHAADQSETVAMRAARGPGGEEGMAGFSARRDVVLLRPLLGVPPAALRDYLRALDISWIEDPSNDNQKFERVRVRRANAPAEAADPVARRHRDTQTAEFLARHAMLSPQGFAVLGAESAPPAALAALLRVVGGRVHAPDGQAVAALAANLRPATLGGVRITAAGRLGAGWLLAREPAGCAPPIPAVQAALWDNRFRLRQSAQGYEIGALGADSMKFRKSSALPALVLRGLPCLRRQGEIVFPIPCQFSPPGPATHAFIS